MSLTREDLDRLCAPSYVDGLGAASMTDLRQRREACQRAEIVLSYLRRVLQGEIDLVLAEMEVRAEGGRSDVGRLVEELPAILSSFGGLRSDQAHLTIPSMEAVAEILDLEEDIALEDLLAHVLTEEELAPARGGGLLPGANLCTFGDEELQATLVHLRDKESALSRRRRLLHEHIDEIQAAIVDRYKSGSADPDSLLR